MEGVYQNLVALTLVAGLPLLSWFVSGPKRNAHDFLFLLGTGLFAVAAAVFVFRATLPVYVAPLAIRGLVYTSILLINEFLCRVAQRRSATDRVFWAAAVVIAPLSVYVEYRVNVYGPMLHHSFMAALQFRVLVSLYRLYRREPSRGLLSMGIAVCIVLVTNVSQTVSASAGVLIQPGLDGMSGIAVYLANILWVMFFSLGFWSYSVDSARKAELVSMQLRTEERLKRESAEQVARDMLSLVRQRDEMIMVNSRFETLNNVGVFNAAFIHELSQPLQKILTKIEFITEDKNVPPAAVEKALLDIKQSAEATSDIVREVRALLADVSAPTSFVSVDDILRTVRPIVESQARADGVQFRISCADGRPGWGVQVNPVLLNRVILNLCSNALAALKGAPLRNRQDQRSLGLTVQCRDGGDGTVLSISVWDNGGGFPEDFDVTLRTLGKSSRPSGMGLGLVICKQIVSTWRGTVSIGRRDSGTEVTCAIPMVRESQYRSATS